MPPQTLLSGTLRRVTVGVSLLTSAVFAFLAGVFVAAASTTPVGVVAPFVAALLYLPILWLHCYAAGYVSSRPTAFGHRRAVESRVGRVAACGVCGASDENGVRRAYAEQLVVAGIPLRTTESGENGYCARCHAVEHGDGGSEDAVERVLEAERN